MNISTEDRDGRTIVSLREERLDALNSGSGCGSKSSASDDMASTYNFSKDVLSAAYNPVGLVVSSFG